MSHNSQNSSICSPGGKDREMYYGQLQEILEFSYLSFKVVLLLVKWFDTSNEGHSDNEDLVNVDDDDADVARGHDGDGGGDDRPPTHHIPTGCGGCFVNRGKGIRKPNLGGRKAGMLHTRQETRNLGLKKITDDKGPVSIRFEWDDKKIMMPLGDHASHWSNYLGELIREIPLYYPSWQKVSAERKATIVTKIGMESSSTREYPSLIHTFFVTHTVGGVFVRDEDRALYDEMLRLQRLGSNTETGVPYTEEEIMAIVRKGKQRGHLLGVGRALSGRSTDGCPPSPQSTVDPADVKKLKKSNKSLTTQVKMMMRLFRSGDKFSQMLEQFESSPEFRGASGSDGCGDDESGGDEDGDVDEEDGDS
ncbi:hypothetical protein Tco_0484027 [Tanacetum coccineum]